MVIYRSNSLTWVKILHILSRSEFFFLDNHISRHFIRLMTHWITSELTILAISEFAMMPSGNRNFPWWRDRSHPCRQYHQVSTPDSISKWWICQHVRLVPRATNLVRWRYKLHVCKIFARLPDTFILFIYNQQSLSSLKYPISHFTVYTSQLPRGLNHFYKIKYAEYLQRRCSLRGLAQRLYGTIHSKEQFRHFFNITSACHDHRRNAQAASLEATEIFEGGNFLRILRKTFRVRKHASPTAHVAKFTLPWMMCSASCNARD